MRGYVTSAFLQREINVALQRAGERGDVAGGDASRSSGSSTALTLHGMTAKCNAIETGPEDAEASKLAGMFSSLLKAMAKD